MRKSRLTHNRRRGAARGDWEKMMSEEDLAKMLNESLAACEGKPFIVDWWLCKDTGDAVLYLENVQSYAEWISPRVTVFRATDDNRVMGMRIGPVVEPTPTTRGDNNERTEHG
jgi:hypothetical protein